MLPEFERLAGEINDIVQRRLMQRAAPDVQDRIDKIIRRSLKKLRMVGDSRGLRFDPDEERMAKESFETFALAISRQIPPMGAKPGAPPEVLEQMRAKRRITDTMVKSALDSICPLWPIC